MGNILFLEDPLTQNAWIKNFPGAVTVCDREGIVLEMNDKAIATFEKDGGASLIGTNLFGCHSTASQAKLHEMIASEKPNIYTIEKNGVKKLIYQAPWYTDGVFSGLVELSIEIPFEMPHFVRG
jgi:transcriptional regulator with PAS, ATPase and Fis domain